MKKSAAYVFGAVILLLSYRSAAQVADEQRLLITNSCPSHFDRSMLPSELEVTYLKGMLRIHALRCPLGDVLQAVEARTGTAMDIAPEAAREVVSVEIGPTTPLLVLRELLEGEKSNYVMIGGPGPGQVRRLVMQVAPPLPGSRPGMVSVSSMAGVATAADAAVSSDAQLMETRTLPTAVELPPDYTPSKGQYPEPGSPSSAESARLSSEEPLPQPSRSERPPNTPAPGQWPWQIDRSLGGAGYQSPAEYVRQFQTGERR